MRRVACRFFAVAVLLLAVGAPPARGTVTGTSSRSDQVGNGSTKTFSFAFKVPDATSVKAYVNGALTGATVTLNPNQDTAPGGTVTFTVAPVSGASVRIQRELGLTQGTVLGPYTKFPAKTVELTFDVLTMGVQQVDRRVGDAESTHASDTAAQAAGLSGEADLRVGGDALLNAAIGQQLAAVRGLNGYTSVADTSTVLATGGSAARALKDRFADTVNVLDFVGVDPSGTTDSTAGIQAAINAALAKPGNGLLVIPHGRYKVTHLDINGANGLKIWANGFLVGATSGTYDSVLTIRNANDLSVYGKLNITGSNNPNYACGLAVYTDYTLASARFVAQVDLHNISIDSVQLARRWGRPTEPHAQVGEIHVFGGHTWNCPQADVAYGSQTFITFHGGNSVADTMGGFVPLGGVMGVIKAVGATIYVNGTELLFPGTPVNDGQDYGIQIEPVFDPVSASVTISSSAGTSVTLASAANVMAGDTITQGANSAFIISKSGNVLTVDAVKSWTNGAASVAGGFGNYYGSVKVSGSEVEIEAQHKVVNPNGYTVATQPLGELAFFGCAGFHARDSFPLIYVYDITFPGSVIVRDSRFLFSSPTSSPGTRVNYNVSCAASAIGNVYVDDSSFGSGFIDGLQGINGCVAHFSNRRILHAFDVGPVFQVVPGGTTLAFTTLESSPDTNRFGAMFNTSTGVFTVPTGGLRSIKVSASFATTTPSVPFDIYVIASGSPYYLGSWPGGASGLGYVSGTVSVFDQPAGATMFITVKTYGALATVVSGYTVAMDIWASR